MFCQSGILEGMQVYPLMKRALDLLPDGVLIIGSNREVLYLNSAFQRLWRIPRDVVQLGDSAMLSHAMRELDDPGEFIKLVERLYRSPHAWEDHINLKDGRVVMRRSVALGAEESGSTRIWIFSDVTEAWNARIDPLTGLPNRRAYAHELPRFLASASSKLKAFALLDVDNFKPYNDLYGHSAGDTALDTVGSLLQSQLSGGSEKVYRIGGEEFAITSTHSDHAAAIRYYQRILRCLEHAGIPHVRNDPYDVMTASIGVALVVGEAELSDVFGEADRALYRAKNQGRNNLVVVTMDDCPNREEARFKA